METFTYQAYAADGSISQGHITAENLRVAQLRLKNELAQRGLRLICVEPVALSRWSARLALRGSGLIGTHKPPRALSAAGLAEWTRQLASLLQAGLPLERALHSSLEPSQPPAQQALLRQLREAVQAGTPLASAMAEHPKDFAPVYTAVVAAGEQSGALDVVLAKLADELEADAQLRSKVLGAVLYPAIVTAVSLLIVVFLMMYVVPQVAQVFAGTKRGLPVLTAVVLAISNSLRSYGWVLLLLGFAAAYLWRRALQTPAWRLRWHTAQLNRVGQGSGNNSDTGSSTGAGRSSFNPLRPLSTLMRDYQAARYANTLALLSGAGVPMLKALGASADTLSNTALQRDAQALVGLVREGAPLASALASQPYWPSNLVVFTRLGEQTGQLPTLLARSGAQLSAQVQRRAVALATLLEPLLIVLMGVFVLLIVLAVMLPIIRMNQLVG